MEKTKKIKLYIGLFYIFFVGLFLFLFFSKFSPQEIMSYDFIKNNRDYFFELKKNNIFLLAIFFIIFTMTWALAGGFGSPVAIIAGFIFGKWFGVLLVTIGLTIGATLLYIFANFFLKDFIKKKFLDKYQSLEKKFKKSEFFYLLVYRFIGGVPWQISCLLPTLFNVRVKNFLFATFLGIIPQIFLAVSIGSGIEKVIDQNSEVPGIIDIIFSPDIYVPLLAFFVLIVISIIFRKKFYRN